MPGLDWRLPRRRTPLRCVKREARTLLWRLFVASFCMMQVMMMAAPTYFASGAEVPADLRRLLHWGSWVLSWPVMLFSATPFLRGAWRSLRRRQLGMDVPVALGIVITFAASTWALGDASGQAEVYFDSLTMFVAFLLAGRWLELKARHGAVQELGALQGDEPAEASRGSAPMAAWWPCQPMSWPWAMCCASRWASAWCATACCWMAARRWTKPC